MKRIQSVPLVIGQFLEAVDRDHAIVGSTTGTFDYIDGGVLGDVFEVRTIMCECCRYSIANC